MLDILESTIKKLEKLPIEKQLEIAHMIQEELNWDDSFKDSQDELKVLAKEAKEDYKAGKSSDQNW